MLALTVSQEQDRTHGFSGFCSPSLSAREHAWKEPRKNRKAGTDVRRTDVKSHGFTPCMAFLAQKLFRILPSSSILAASYLSFAIIHRKSYRKFPIHLSLFWPLLDVRLHSALYLGIFTLYPQPCSFLRLAQSCENGGKYAFPPTIFAC